MNILREIRRTRQKNFETRVRLILSFSLILIVTTYAWFSTQKDVKVGGLEGKVTSWDVEYYLNEDKEQFLDVIAPFTIDEFYPGMPKREDITHIYNVGTSSTNIKYELMSIKVFGQEVYKRNKNGEIEINNVEITTQGNTTYVFSNKNEYPFNISYTYDKTYLKGKFESSETTPNAEATFKYNVEWTFEGNGTESENYARDVLDTKFGKDAYKYYSDEANDPSKAIEVQVRITSSMIHPSLEK